MRRPLILVCDFILFNGFFFRSSKLTHCSRRRQLSSTVAVVGVNSSATSSLETTPARCF